MFLMFFMPAPLDSVGECVMFSAVPLSVRPFVRLSGQILLPQPLMNGLNYVDNTDVEYSLAPTD